MDGRQVRMSSRIIVTVKRPLHSATLAARSATVCNRWWIAVGHAPVGGACQDLGAPVAAWRGPGSAPAAAHAPPGMLLLSLQPCGTQSLALQGQPWPPMQCWPHPSRCSGVGAALEAQTQCR